QMVPFPTGQGLYQGPNLRIGLGGLLRRRRKYGDGAHPAPPHQDRAGSLQPGVYPDRVGHRLPAGGRGQMMVAATIALSGLALALFLTHLRRRRRIRQMTETLMAFAESNRILRARLCTRARAFTVPAPCINRVKEEIQESEGRTAYLAAERTRLLTHVSHDPRTPLTSLLG